MARTDQTQRGRNAIDGRAARARGTWADVMYVAHVTAMDGRGRIVGRFTVDHA